MSKKKKSPQSKIIQGMHTRGQGNQNSVYRTFSVTHSLQAQLALQLADILCCQGTQTFTVKGHEAPMVLPD